MVVERLGCQFREDVLGIREDRVPFPLGIESVERPLSERVLIDFKELCVFAEFFLA